MLNTFRFYLKPNYNFDPLRKFSGIFTLYLTGTANGTRNGIMINGSSMGPGPIISICASSVPYTATCPRPVQRELAFTPVLGRSTFSWFPYTYEEPMKWFEKGWIPRGEEIRRCNQLYQSLSSIRGNKFITHSAFSVILGNFIITILFVSFWELVIKTIRSFSTYFLPRFPLLVRVSGCFKINSSNINVNQTYTDFFLS